MKLLTELKRLILSHESESPALEFAAGVEKEIQVARSGTFRAKTGKHTLTKEFLSGLATRFDHQDEHKIKIGHAPIREDTPDYGDVVGLSYDSEADRLKARIVPTQLLVEKNQKEGFRRVSMELGGADDYESLKFGHLAVLAAHPVAITGLDPVELSGTAPGMVLAFSEGEDETEVAFSVTPKAPEPTPRGGGLTSSVLSASKKETADMSAELTAELETAKARLARFEKQAKDGAADRVKAFRAANIKRIPMLMWSAGLEGFLTELLASEASLTAPTICFAAPDRTEKKVSPAEGFLLMLAAMPEQVTEEDKTEIVKKGEEEDPEKKAAAADFAGADEESVTLHLAAEREIAEAKSKGEEIVYLEGVRRAEKSRRGR